MQPTCSLPLEVQGPHRQHCYPETLLGRHWRSQSNLKWSVSEAQLNFGWNSPKKDASRNWILAFLLSSALHIILEPPLLNPDFSLLGNARKTTTHARVLHLYQTQHIPKKEESLTQTKERLGKTKTGTSKNKVWMPAHWQANQPTYCAFPTTVRFLGFSPGKTPGNHKKSVNCTKLGLFFSGENPRFANLGRHQSIHC